MDYQKREIKILIKKPKVVLLLFFFSNWELNIHEEIGGNPQTCNEILESKCSQFSIYTNTSKCVKSVLPLKIFTEIYLFLGTYNLYRTGIKMLNYSRITNKTT